MVFESDNARSWCLKTSEAWASSCHGGLTSFCGGAPPFTNLCVFHSSPQILIHHLHLHFNFNIYISIYIIYVHLLIPNSWDYSHTYISNTVINLIHSYSQFIIHLPMLSRRRLNTRTGSFIKIILFMYGTCIWREILFLLFFSDFSCFSWRFLVILFISINKNLGIFNCQRHVVLCMLLINKDEIFFGFLEEWD